MKLSNDHIEELAQNGLAAAQQAAEYISSQVNKTHQIELKSGLQSLSTQVVTAIDMESQRLIITSLDQSIQKYDLGLLAEESQDNGSRFLKDYFWCIDPLDGTLPFTEQRQGYAVSISLISKFGEPIIGTVIDPYHKKNYVAIKGLDCEIDGKPFQFNRSSKKQLIFNFDRSFGQANNYKEVVANLDLISEELGYQNMHINFGAGAVMNALYLLDSDAGCYFKFPKRELGGGCIWDFAATSLIYKELGLWVSDISGNPLTLNRRDSPYMNECGILYATDLALGKEIVKLSQRLIQKQ